MNLRSAPRIFIVSLIVYNRNGAVNEKEFQIFDLSKLFYGEERTRFEIF